MKMRRNNTVLSFAAWGWILSQALFHTNGQVVHASDRHTRSKHKRSLIDSMNGIEPRIVGGSDAEASRYPYMVFLADREDNLACGGTIISPTVVLTSAHCQTTLLIEAVLGRYNTSHFTTDENLERINVLQEIQHPLFDSRTVSYDMMLLQLEHAPKRDQNQRYVRLNNDKSFMTGSDITGRQEPESVLVLGWGHTEPQFGEPSEILQQAELNFVPNFECSQAADGALSYNGRITDDMLCTFAENKDSCYGDSGGPLILPGNNYTEDVQMGTVSWGRECADPIFPGVASRVSYGYEWIRTWVCALDGNMAPEHYQCPPNATYSPAPTSSPTAPTISPAPTIATIAVLVNIHLDRFANEVSWNVVETETGLPIVQRPFGTYQYENEVTESVLLRPETEYKFTIMDQYGDGLINKGFYQIITEDESLVLVKGPGSYGRERTHVFQTPAITFGTWAPSNPPSLIPSTPPTMKPSNSPSYVPAGTNEVFDVVGTPSDVAGRNITLCLDGQYISCSFEGDCCGSQSCKNGLCVPHESSSPHGQLDDSKIKESGGTDHRREPPV